MASVSSSPDGLRILQFVDAAGERRSIRLGKMTLKTADTIKGKVEELLVAKVTGTSMTRELADWVASIGKRLHEKMAAKGLVEPKKPPVPAVPVEAPFCHSQGSSLTSSWTCARSETQHPDHLYPDAQDHGSVLRQRPADPPDYRGRCG